MCSLGSYGTTLLLTVDAWLIFQLFILNLNTLTWVGNLDRFAKTQLCPSSLVSPNSAVFGNIRHPLLLQNIRVNKDDILSFNTKSHYRPPKHRHSILPGYWQKQIL